MWWTIPLAVATYVASTQNAKKQRKADKKALEQQNEYNSPASQMKRLQEAGLNPNLVYGGGNVTGNQSGLLKQDYSRDTDAMNNALTQYMAIDNHDKDMQMKAEDILDKSNQNKLFNATFEYQKQKAMTEDKILNARLRMEEAQANLLTHDWNLVKNTKTLSKDTGLVPRLERWLNGVDSTFQDTARKLPGLKR